ncbi:MAG: integrin [Burkholderiales bacterium]
MKEVQLTWPAANGAAFYRVLENPDGVSGFVQVGADLTALSFNHTIPVHRRLNASYIVEACNNIGCTSSAPQAPGANLTQAIGYFKASNTGADDRFGIAVALSGDGNTLAVGAAFEASSTSGIDSVPDDTAVQAGAVYVFTRIAGAWSQQAYVKASNAQAGDRFGISLALSADGNTLAVGAPNEDSSSTGVGSTPNELASPAAGAAYVFTRSGGTWSEQAYVKPLNPGSLDQFGTSVALSADGNTLAVGADREASSTTGINTIPNEGANDAGAAYVFTRSGITWSQQAYVKPSNTGADDRFGSSVALSSDGNTLAVGARLEDSNTTGVGSTPNDLALNAGAAYVFTRSGITWSQQAYVKASNTQTGDNFGGSVALSGDGNTLAVGSIGEDSSTTGIGSTPDELAADAGAVYVFTRGGIAWSQQAYVKPLNSGVNDTFGRTVALSGDGNALLVGANGEDGSSAGISGTPNEGAPEAGAAYVFTRSIATWSQQVYVKASNTGTGVSFGGAVALSGDGNTLAVGALNEDSSTTGIGSTPDESAVDAGAVYLY